MRRLFVILFIILMCTSTVEFFNSSEFFASAQEDPQQAEENAQPLIYGQVVSGRLDNFTPSQVYYFDALRGDYLSVQVRTTGGNLDPLLTVVDSSGRAVASRDDSGGDLSPLVDSLLIQNDGRYYVVVARFGYGLGTTAGQYELLIERIGNSSVTGSAMRYGDNVLNTITNDAPEIYYRFQSEQGDIVNITMEQYSGDLDPKLQVWGISGTDLYLLQESDDVLGSLNASIEGLVIPASGTYIIVATRYGQAAGPSSGNFLLTLQEASNSGLGNTAQAAVPMSIGDRVEGEVTVDETTRYYRFEAQQDDIITIRMSRVDGSLDCFVVLANAGLQELISDDDSGGGQNSEVERFIIPASGTYYIFASRFEQEAGGTTGGFRLEIEDLGNAFDGVPANIQRIRYNTPVTGNVDDITPQTLYAFFGTEDDVTTVSITRGDGDLDPVVSILDADSQVVASSGDDGNPQNARIQQYVLPSTGVYFVQVSRAVGENIAPTSGTYILVLAQLVNGE